MNARLRALLPLAVVWMLLLAYGVYFSAYSIQQHRAFLTHASDLGQIDQAIWNTLQGRVLEHTRAGGVQASRLSAHFEPVFIPLSLVFLIYDNVEALLIIQSWAIALGALAVYWIAARRFAVLLGPRGVGTNRRLAPTDSTAWVGVAFAALYLLFPALEAANLAEFHAVTLAAAPLLLAYHYGDENRWTRFALFSLLALSVKEEIALLVFVMAAWFALRAAGVSLRELLSRAQPSDSEQADHHYTPGLVSRGQPRPSSHQSLLAMTNEIWPRGRAPALVAALALVWFAVAILVVIPHFNALGRSPFTCRYVVGEDCPPVVNGLFLGERLGYLLQLFASVGWIALLDPLALLLGLPLLAANLVSNYPAQFSGTYHYSAPVAPYLVLAAIGGSARAVEWLQQSKAITPSVVRKRATLAVLVPVLLLAFGYHLFAGYTPVGGAFSWPNVTAHNQTFDRLAAQIPPDAIVSTTSALNPHLSHRRVLYRYPTVKDAEYVLLDVSESTSANPVDFRIAYNSLVDDGTFGVVDSADGYVLLRRGAPEKPLADAFYSIFRANNPQPQYPVRIDFGGRLRLLGYDVLTDQYGRASVRTYWQRLKAMDRNYIILPFYPDAEGGLRKDLSLQSTFLFWYPTAAWKANEVVVGQTVPFDLGPRARFGVVVMDGDDWENPDIRLPVHIAEPQGLTAMENSTWVELGELVKEGGRYHLIPKQQ